MIKTFCFKLYKSKRNRKLHEQLDMACRMYNHCIALHRRYYSLFKITLNKYRLKRQITKLKKTSKYNCWKLVPSQAIHDIVDRIDRAYGLYFSGLKSKIKSSRPHFKKLSEYKSITISHHGYKFLEGNTVRIGKQYYR